LLPDPVADRAERRLKILRLAAAGLCHVRPPTTTATNLAGHVIDEIPCLDAFGLCLGNTGNQGNLAISHGAQYDGCRTQLVLQLIDGLAQPLGIGTFQCSRQHLDTTHFLGLTGEVAALATGQLGLQCLELFFQPAVTLDGVRLTLSANIERADDVETVRNSGAEGVGLFRTEFLFLNRDTLPSEQEQLDVYRKVAVGLKPQPLVIRTVDLGGDKQGSRALSQYAPTIEHLGHTMLFVVNPYRPFMDTVHGIQEAIAEIQASSRLQVSALVSNPNLMSQTTVEIFEQGHQLVTQAGNSLGLPIAFAVTSESLSRAVDRLSLNVELMAIHRFFLMFDSPG